MDGIFERLRADVLKQIKESGMIKAGDAVLAAFSGGADSVALLLLLREISGHIGFSVCASHVNHGIRGEEADRDERFCRMFCDKRGIPFASSKVNIPETAEKSGEGLEECARRIRYEELERMARAFGCNKIATAHHADDNIETVLMHMIRGCGLKGLAGIPPVRGNIIRPILGIPRRDIISCLAELGVGYVNDSTNDDTDLSRNLLRHTVLPQLYRLNPEVDAAISRMCGTVAQDSAFLEKVAGNVPDNADISVLGALDCAVLSRYIRIKYETVLPTGKRQQLDAQSVRLITDAIKNYNGAVKYALPGKVFAYINANGLFFYTEKDNVHDSYYMRLSEGENIISPYGYRILITRDKNVAYDWQNIYKLSILTSVNSDRIINGREFAVSIRNRKPGDSYRFGGHTRDIRRQLINFGIPAFRRRYLPCFVDKNGDIFWVPGLPLEDSARVRDPEHAIYIVFADENA